MRRSSYSVIALVFLAGLVMFAFRPAAAGSPLDRGASEGVVLETPVIEPVSPFPLLVLWDPWDYRDVQRTLQPVDPLTLEPLPGYEPIEFETGGAGGFIETAISPDGATAALVVHSPGDPMSSVDPATITLHIVDLVGWTDSVVAEWPASFGYASSAEPLFSADGTRLYWTKRTPGTGERTLVRFDLEHAAQAELASLPADFVPLDYRISLDETRWYVFGVPVQQNLPVDSGYVLGEFTVGDAELLVVELDSGEIASRIELDGVAAGGVPIEGLDDDGYPLQNMTPGLAWDLAASRLYIGHAGSGRATVVDLDDGVVRDRFTLDEGFSWLDRLASWLAPSAQAVVRALAYGHATELDGGDIFVASAAMERLTADRQKLEAGEHYPVWAIDTASGDQLWQAHLGGVVGLAEAPDREHVLVQTASRIFRLDAIGEHEVHRLYLLDPDTGDIVRALDLPGRPDSGLGSMSLSHGLVYLRVRTRAGPMVIVVEPADLSVVGSWQRGTGEASIYKLIPLP